MGFENLMGKAEEIRKKAIEAHMAEWRIQREGEKNWDQTYTADMEVQVRETRSKVEAEFADIPSLFAPFTRTPDPNAFTAQIDELKGALAKLSTGQGSADPISTNGRLYPANLTLEKIKSAGDDVTGWSGKAAQTFKTQYLDPFPAVVKNQFTILAALKAALEAEQAMWKETRKNIWDIADNTYKALERMDECDQNEWTMAFTVVASVCAVVALPLTGGASLAVAAAVITAIGATAQVVAAAEVKESPKSSIQGETTRPVINSMREAIKKQEMYVVETENRIRQVVSAMNDLVHSAHNETEPEKNLFCIKRPALADAGGGNIRDNMGFTD